MGTALFFLVLAIYLYLKKSGFDLSNFGWIPIISLSLVIFIASLGIISLPFVVTTELLPNKVRQAFKSFHVLHMGVFLIPDSRRRCDYMHECYYIFCLHHFKGKVLNESHFIMKCFEFFLF